MFRPVRQIALKVGALMSMAIVSSALTGAENPPAERVLFDFANQETSGQWGAVNDGVMGGVSRGGASIQPESRTLEFAGNLSLENNGGFSSIRTYGEPVNLGAFDGVALRVRGDGRKYHFTIQTDYRIMAGSYRADFETTRGEWVEVRLPFSDFHATSFGRRLPSAPPLNRAVIESCGVMLADKKAGPFRLEIAWIKAWRKDAPTVEVASDATDPSPDSSLDSIKTALARAKRGQRLIDLAIRRGAPMYNAGMKDACAAIYEVAAHGLMGLCADELGEGSRRRMETVLARLDREHDVDQKAWALRHVLDDAHRSLGER